MKTIEYNNQTYFRAGPGQTRDSVIFHCGATSAMLEMFEGVVTSTGPHYCWVAVTGNRELSAIRVSRQAIQPGVGDRVLVGPLKFGGDTVKAETLTVLSVNGTKPKAAPKDNTQRRPNPTPALKPALEIGEITSVSSSGTYGFVFTQAKESVFLPGSALRNVALVKGARVRFKRGATDRGPIALEAYAA